MSTLQPHQQRVINEKREIDERIEKLNVFFNTETFRNLSRQEVFLLIEQEDSMSQYSGILTRRIELFKEQS